MNQLQTAEQILKKNLLASKKVDEKGFQKNKTENPEMFNAMLNSLIEYGEIVHPDNLLVGKTVDFLTKQAKRHTGIVQCMFTDGLASGTNQYIPITYFLIKTVEGNVHDVLPRNILKINN